MKESLSKAVTVVLVLGALVISGLVVRRELLTAPPAAQASIPDRDVQEWERFVSAGHVLGDPDAPLRIAEFSDFLCGFCRRVSPELQRLVAKHSGRVAIMYRHFVNEEIKPDAFRAALASECAADQGRFRLYHDALFLEQDSIGSKPWASFAAATGVPDLAEFQVCVDEERFRARVEADVRDALELGIPGTPAFVFNGKLLVGVSAPARLERMVQEAIASGEGAAAARP